MKKTADEIKVGDIIKIECRVDEITTNGTDELIELVKLDVRPIVIEKLDLIEVIDYSGQKFVDLRFKD